MIYGAIVCAQLAAEDTGEDGFLYGVNLVDDLLGGSLCGVRLIVFQFLLQDTVELRLFSSYRIRLFLFVDGIQAIQSGIKSPTLRHIQNLQPLWKEEQNSPVQHSCSSEKT